MLKIKKYQDTQLIAKIEDMWWSAKIKKKGSLH